MEDPRLKVPSVLRNGALLGLFCVSGVLFLVVLQQIGGGSVRAATLGDDPKRQRMTCELIFHGFFVNRESEWGPLKMADVGKEWERQKCLKLVVTCDKLATLSAPDGRGGGMLKTFWEELECKGTLRFAQPKPVPLFAFPQPLNSVKNAALVQPSALPASNLANISVVVATSSFSSSNLTAPSVQPTSLRSLPLSVVRQPVHKAVSPKPLSLPPPPSPSPSLPLPPPPPSSSSSSSSSSSLSSPSSSSSSSTILLPPRPPVLVAVTGARKRDRYTIEYVPPPAPFNEQTLHWCVSARDKYKIWPNETSSLPKVLSKLDKSYHDKWKSDNCHDACQAADEWELKKENMYISLIASLPKSSEKRVISFSLYGSNPKYTQGAVRNAELVNTYFPGWVCRFYSADVPEPILSRLKQLGAEVLPMTNYGNMLSRFLVAADPTVDRYIMRDTDSRLNHRDRLAVEEWIDSGMKIHTIRDHINHCHPLMGGMWGGVKGAIPGFEVKVKNLMRTPMAREYMTDMHFLRNIIWPQVQQYAFQHDTYCCKGYQGSVSLPSRRPLNYLHVGQIHDQFDNAVMLHIENHIRDFPNPPVCRDASHQDWIYG